MEEQFQDKQQQSVNGSISEEGPLQSGKVTKVRDSSQQAISYNDNTSKDERATLHSTLNEWQIIDQEISLGEKLSRAMKPGKMMVNGGLTSAVDGSTPGVYTGRRPVTSGCAPAVGDQNSTSLYNEECNQRHKNEQYDDKRDVLLLQMLEELAEL
jgi:hypothetical protein